MTLTQGYWLGKTEVTQAQWEALMGSNPSNFKGADRPVEQVSWSDAKEFCAKLTERERTAGRLPEGYEYTLPTEAEWEYACRAGSIGDFAGELDKMGWFLSNSENQAHPVAQKQANAWGFYDMHGNVGEWCLDWYGAYPVAASQDPTGSAFGSYRVFRGGSWHDDAQSYRSARRNFGSPDKINAYVGFRVALAPSPR